MVKSTLIHRIGERPLDIEVSCEYGNKQPWTKTRPLARVSGENIGSRMLDYDLGSCWHKDRLTTSLYVKQRKKPWFVNGWGETISKANYCDDNHELLPIIINSAIRKTPMTITGNNYPNRIARRAGEQGAWATVGQQAVLDMSATGEHKSKQSHLLKGKRLVLVSSFNVNTLNSGQGQDVWNNRKRRYWRYLYSKALHLSRGNKYSASQNGERMDVTDYIIRKSD